MYSTGMLLSILVIGCSAISNETSRFLSGNGLGNLEPTFVDQEIEVRQIPALPDHLLVELGVRTIGARLRIRSAASHWLQNQVFVSFINLKMVFSSSNIPILFVANFCSSKVGMELRSMAQLEKL